MAEDSPHSDDAPREATAGAVSVSFWRRIKEHKVLHWGVGYLAVAAAIAQSQDVLIGTFGWPTIISRAVMGILVLGLPIALTLAWYHGHKGLQRATRGEMTIISLMVAIAAAVLIVYLRSSTAPDAKPVAAASVAATAPAPKPAMRGVSLAVLPFVNMSSDPEQEYFSDGLSEEILNQLAQIKEMRVAGRTSSFAFKGKNEDLRVIAEKLGVNHVLEGSVRKAGERVRITAQLIDASDGSHLWSQSYDRKLGDIFAIQEEIARAAVDALRITLGVGQSIRLPGGTTNVDAYDKYLRARSLWLQLGREQLLRAVVLFREAVTLDPQYARGWYALADALLWALPYQPDAAATVRERDAAIEHSLALAPDAWWSHGIRAERLMMQRKWSAAEAAARAAVEKEPPSEFEGSTMYSLFLMSVGRTNEAVKYFEHARDVEPSSLGISGIVQNLLAAAGRDEEALAEYKRGLNLAGDRAGQEMTALQMLWRRTDASPAAIEEQFRVMLESGGSSALLNRTLAGKLDDVPAARAAIRQAFANPAKQDATQMLLIARYADHFGDKDVALAALRRSVLDLNGEPAPVWSRWESDLRTDPHFEKLVRDLGLYGYFRASGQWPDACKPVGKDDFSCT